MAVSKEASVTLEALLLAVGGVRPLLRLSLEEAGRLAAVSRGNIAAALSASFLLFQLLRRMFKRPAKVVCKGKCIVVTGCDSGFGKQLVLAAVDAGFEVVAACFTDDGAAQYDDASITTVVADLTTAAGCERVVAAAKATAGGGLHALVNNAGLCLPGNVEWLPMSAYEASMALNFHAPVSLTFSLLPELKACKGSRVVNVTSVDGFIALPSNAAYNASKHALEAYSDTLRCEMLPWGVKVCVIEPATMRTPLALAFADAWLKGFKAAPPERTAAYGAEWAQEHAATTKQSISDIAADPQVTVSALMASLTLEEPPPRVATGKAASFLFKPLSMLPDGARDKVLYAISFGKNKHTPVGFVTASAKDGDGDTKKKKQRPPRLPPAGVTSHVTIRVRSHAASVPWYESLGFTRLKASSGEDAPADAAVSDGMILLRGGSHSKWQPLLLLLEDPNMASRGASYDAGMTRLSIYVKDLPSAIARLSAQGLEPMAPPAGNRAGRIAAYHDPDGFVVYLITMYFPLSPTFSLARWWYGVSDPQLFHWTINVESIDDVMRTFEKVFGFSTVYDAQPHQVQADMLPAFGISATTTIIKHIRLCKLPSDAFLGACLMEWTEPRTTRKGAEKLNSVAYTVEDVEASLAKAGAAGLVTEQLTKKNYPALGEALVGAVYIDGGSRVELVKFAAA